MPRIKVRPLEVRISAPDRDDRDSLKVDFTADGFRWTSLNLTRKQAKELARSINKWVRENKNA
jgi:hypothetical protein